jgi:2-methylisocitrate lyase-like PEP mutase family enzyme
MNGDQAEAALARIEAALARIEAAAARRKQAQADLAARHDALKSAVAETLGDLDELIGSSSP